MRAPEPVLRDPNELPSTDGTADTGRLALPGSANSPL
jgi:hypothetical protein